VIKRTLVKDLGEGVPEREPLNLPTRARLKIRR
jgi:hypothetical protein